mmetsp:Transcript_30358/g.88766  ORF Transcript_30358/g.88766 Transcript_30358/m.88766 type:complete len:275 (+) Transcript_30358:108-932(+)
MNLALGLSLGVTGGPTVGAAGGMITGADGGDGADGAAVAAVAKVEAGGLVLDELGVGTAAHLAGDVLDDVLAQERFDVLGHVLAADDEALVAVDGALGTELGHEELEDVLGGALHHGADLLEVDPEGLLGADAGELGGLHVAALLLDEVGVVGVEDADDAVEELGVGVVGLAVVGVGDDLLAGLVVGDDGALGGEVLLGGAGAAGTTLGGGAVSSGGRLGLAAARLVLVLGLLLLFLLLAQIEHGGHFGLLFGAHGCVALGWELGVVVSTTTST